MEGNRIEVHPFEPWLPENAVVLMCGTFPPQPKRWKMEFYYPNFINDMWRVFGLIYFGDKDAFIDKENSTFRLDAIKKLLLEKGIALSDTGREVIRLRDNASDKFLEIVRPIDLKEMLGKLPHLKALATTGEKAAGVIAEATGTKVPAVGEYVECENPAFPGKTFLHWRMPSTSRAYPLRLEKKAEYYRKMLQSAGAI